MSEYGCKKDCLTAEERKKILSRFHSLLFWVGEFVPELEEVEGREMPLRDVVFRFITERYPDEGYGEEGSGFGHSSWSARPRNWRRTCECRIWKGLRRTG